MGEEGLPPLRIWSSLAKLDTVKRWKNLVVLRLHDKHYFYYFRLLRKVLKYILILIFTSVKFYV